MVRHIQIGGESRPITFNVNALIEFEEITGIDITEFEGRKSMTRMKNIRALAYCGLKYGYRQANGKYPDFTIEDVGGWMDKDNVGSITESFLKENPPEEEGGEAEEGDKKKLDGETSGQ